MRKKDTNSVAYLFKEMDPSEELEFERELRNNENLLIEVESLKQINDRLSAIPSIDPPEEVVKSIQNFAKDRVTSKKKSGAMPVYIATAAMIMVGFFAGAVVMDFNEQEGTAVRANLGGSTFQLPATESVNDFQGRKIMKPWVDNNEVLRFTDGASKIEATSMDSVFRNSYQRLKPVTDPLQSNIYQRNLQLTGSRP